MRPGHGAGIGGQRMAGAAGAKDLRAMRIKALRQITTGRRGDGADGATTQRIPAAYLSVSAPGPQQAPIRGEGNRPDRQARAFQRVQQARCLHAPDRHIATEGRHSQPRACGIKAEGDDGPRARFHFAHGAIGRDQAQHAIHAAGGKAAIWQRNQRIQRQAGFGDDLVAAIGGPKADGAVEASTHQRAIGAEGNRVYIAAMAFQDLRAAIGKVPQAHRAIPGSRGQKPAACGKCGDLPHMPFQNLRRRRAKPRRPKRDAPTFPGAGHAPIGQKGECIDAAAMPARHRACLPGACIP